MAEAAGHPEGSGNGPRDFGVRGPLDSETPRVAIGARPTIPLILILLLAAVLRVYGIGSESLWFDEAASVRIVRQDFSTMLRSIREDERIPPLHYLILQKEN